MARFFTYTSMKRLLMAILVYSFIVSIFVGSLAEEPIPAPTAVSYTDYNNSTANDEEKIYLGLYSTTEPQSIQANDLYNLKKILYENGYYEAAGVNNSEISWQSNQLDEITLNALREYCIRNNCSQFDNQLGLTYGAWWRINSGEIINLNAPQVEEEDGYKEIKWEESGENLTQIIDRLYELEYLENRSHDVYDKEVRDALEAFGKNNGLQDYYEHDGTDEVRSIDADIQRVLFSQDANKKPAPKKGGLREYFMQPVPIAGLSIPMLVIWCVGLVVLVAGILAAIYLFMPSDSKKAGKSKKNLVHFDIAYNGKNQRTEAEITKTLKIGRGIGNFPLDLTDTKISRRHCELYYANDMLMLRDYSANGTIVNGKTVHNAEEILKSGYELIIGDHHITVNY